MRRKAAAGPVRPRHRETPFTAQASEHGGQKTAEAYHADSALDENRLDPIGHISGTEPV